MTRPEHLYAVVAGMSPPTVREIVRAALKAFTADEHAEWLRIKDNERKQVKRDAAKKPTDQFAETDKLVDVRFTKNEQTGQVPVGVEGEDRTSSGLLHRSQPDKEERFQTSKEETDQEKKPLRGKEKKVEPELICPAELDTPEFRAEFKRWMQFRRGLGKKPHDWLVMFEEQLRWLEPFGRATATAILGQSIRNGWQGLFELKQPVNGTCPPRKIPTPIDMKNPITQF